MGGEGADGGDDRPRLAGLRRRRDRAPGQVNVEGQGQLLGRRRRRQWVARCAQPAGEGLGDAQGLQAPVGVQESLLGGVLGLVGVAQEGVGVAEGGVLVARTGRQKPPAGRPAGPPGRGLAGRGRRCQSCLSMRPPEESAQGGELVPAPARRLRIGPGPAPRPAPGPGALRPGWVGPGHRARPRPATPLRPPRDRGPADAGSTGRRHRSRGRGRQPGARAGPGPPPGRGRRDSRRTSWGFPACSGSVPGKAYQRGPHRLLGAHAEVHQVGDRLHVPLRCMSPRSAPTA